MENFAKGYWGIKLALTVVMCAYVPSLNYIMVKFRFKATIFIKIFKTMLQILSCIASLVEGG